MISYVALLRGINVGGRTMVPMAELKALCEKEGLADVVTLLQSGNVIFKSDSSAAKLELQLEKAATKKFGREIDFFVRNGGDWKKLVAKNPFPAEAKDDPGHLVVLCLKVKPSAAALATLKSAIVGREYFRAGDRCLYLVYPDGIGTSKLTNAVIDRKLGTTGTARNWNTVRKIAALME
jgi:uncharacterized protein (DUF1697 family)